ncbi:TniQ family protein [Streptomyces sp. OfavH-34-F]|uniref:TniQ family protein n=1 Tax=Streptomyces sp. OfavH-34-F TaxID=2917760 RepID=UPI001EF2E8B9|nr:TniQ family protein [Streptomyces sp. OfavH-34-F]MCG7526923.1 TniQ family protein [Streptomyces sp. OfavH-34-F]
MRHPLEQLPRSLSPLPGEDLHGFVLRLAHRLDMKPVVLLQHTGLIAPNSHSAPAPRMFMLEKDALAAFCATTGMTTHDADALTFKPHVNSYPPVAEALLGMRGLTPAPRGVFPAWLLTTSTRYCPSCLAGDSSAIQQRHGGPWQLAWRMAANFACLEHRCFLRTTCPSCELPVQMIRGTSRSLIVEPHADPLHPAQCRNVVDPRRGPCGARLDTADLNASDFPSDDLLHLQRRLLQARPYGASSALDPLAGHNRMTDLLVLAALIRATWPLTANLAPSGSLAQALEDDLSRPGPAPSLRISSTAQKRWDSDVFSARGTAALLAISARILNLPLPELRLELGRLIAESPPRDDIAWGHTWLTLRRDSSPLFRHEVLQLLDQRFPRPLPTQVALPGFLQIRQRSYSPQAIPQQLPEEWTQIITAPLGHSGRSPGNVAIRRALAAHLVQAATGMSLKEAGAYLGIPSAWMDAWGRFRPLEERLHGRRVDLPTLFQRLADHVADQPPLDYHARRKRFANWTLSDSAMQKIVDKYPSRRRFIVGGSHKASRIGTGFSALVWSRLTGSEWRLAPDLQPLPRGGVDVVDASIICSLQGRDPTHQPFYKYLHDLLPDYASAILGGEDH